MMLLLCRSLILLAFCPLRPTKGVHSFNSIRQSISRRQSRLFSRLKMIMTNTDDGCNNEYRCLQIGLTGSIGMGKSTITKHFQSLGFPVFDADSTVHKLYSSNGAAVERLKMVFPDAINESDNSVNRQVLASKVLASQDGAALRLLESIVHPLVAAERQLFYEQACQNKHLMVIYDIPLLLENPASYKVDYVMVATADSDTQRRRVLSRPNMTEMKFESILSKQLSDAEKRARADYLVHTNYEGYAQARSQVARAVEAILGKHTDHFNSWKRGVAAAGKGAVGGSYLKTRFDAVVFDLDDTLVPLLGPIQGATSAFNTFLREQMPLTFAEASSVGVTTSSVGSGSRLRDTMVNIAKEDPLIAHDVTELRRAALRMLARGKGSEEALVDEAIDLFLQERSDLSPHLYDDTLSCLQHLREQGVIVAILSNGNADISRCAEISRYVQCSLSAVDAGALKPSVVPFVAIAQRLGVAPSRVLFVGDSVEHDAMGAKGCGMTSALLVRSSSGDAGEVNRITINERRQLQQGEYERHVDLSLQSLEPSEFERKVREFIASKECFLANSNHLGKFLPYAEPHIFESLFQASDGVDAALAVLHHFGEEEGECAEGDLTPGPH